MNSLKMTVFEVPSEGEQLGLHGEVGSGRRRRVVGGRREGAVDVVVVHGSQAELLQVVDALDSPRRLPRGLHSGQQERDEYRDDGDDDQEFDEREAPATVAHVR
jgi:hypothetical protein